MMENPHKILDDLKPEKDFFIGIDSDGCVFDTMEIKQKECFCPLFIKHFNLQRVSKFARETWEFVNLYSNTRGANRFLALIHTMDLLKERKKIIDRNAYIIDLSPLKEWTGKENKLGNPALKKYAEEINDPVINKVLEWSLEVNKVIEELVFDIPPFPFFNESLQKMKMTADLMVVSQTPQEALKREWREHNIDSDIRIIAGQEYGTKTEHIKYAAKGKYPDNKILMIGDALGDLNAAKSNGVLFFPVNPGFEEDSWQRLNDEGLEKFFNGTYSGDYEEKLINDFRKLLPENPPWKE